MGLENQVTSKPESQSNTALSDFAANSLTSSDTLLKRADDTKSGTTDSALSQKDDAGTKAGLDSTGTVGKDSTGTIGRDSSGEPTGTIDFNQFKLGALAEKTDFSIIGSDTGKNGLPPDSIKFPDAGKLLKQLGSLDKKPGGSEPGGEAPGGDPKAEAHPMPSTPNTESDLVKVKGDNVAVTGVSAPPLTKDAQSLATDQKQEAGPESGDKQPAKEGSFFGNLVKSGTKELADAASWLSPEKLLGKGDAAKDETAGDATKDAAAKKTATTIEKAGQGAPHLEAQEKQFTDHWNKNASGKSEARTHESTFTTAPTKDNPNGLTYKNIQYDKNGDVSSFETPSGHIQTRTSKPDAQGFADWKCTDKAGHLVPYSGAGSSTWRDKVSIDKETGVHHYIGSGKNGGAMFSRHPDGSLVESRPRVEGGKTRGMETTVELPDGTKVSRSSKWDGEKLVPDSSNVKVKGNDGSTSTVDAHEPGKEKVLNTTESKAKSEGKDKSDPTDKTNSRAESQMEMLKSLMNPSSLDALKNVSDLSISKTSNPNEYAVGLHLKNPVAMPAPNVRITGLGPFGGASAVPRDSSVQNLNFNVRTTNNPGQLEVVGIQGMHGSSDVYGPRGKHRMTTSSNTEWMRFNLGSSHPHVDVKSSGLGHPLSLDSRHMGSEGLSGKLLQDKAFQQQVFDGIKALQTNVDSFKFHQKSPGNFEGSVNPKAKELELNKKVPIVGGLEAEVGKLYFNEKGPVNFNLSSGKDGAPELKFNKGDVKVGLKLAGQEMKLDVAKLSAGQDKQGRPIARIQFDGLPQEFEVPLYSDKKK